MPWRGGPRLWCARCSFRAVLSPKTRDLAPEHQRPSPPRCRWSPDTMALLELFPMRLLGKALTFDDVLLVPAYSQILPKDASLATQFSRNIHLNLPLVSAAMDTVTEARLAIAIAQ